MSRDNFTKVTIDILAKRVGYCCSNPDCKKYTVGPNEDKTKATSIGIAAHITGASPGGPRYDENVNSEERKHISNGIWLCSNCATLIDKDEKEFPIQRLLDWKEVAESEMRNAILTSYSKEQIKTQNPFIEADLIWSGGMRGNNGYSWKNREKFGGNIIPAWEKPIIHWELSWRFKFVLHNNSSYPAYNIQIKYLNDVQFSELTSLPKVNNLPPFANIDLSAKFLHYIESEHTEADEIMKQKLPIMLDGLIIEICYEDENRNEHKTLLTIEKQIVNNTKI